MKVDTEKPSSELEKVGPIDLQKMAASDLRRQALEFTAEQLKSHAERPLLERILQNKQVVEGAISKSPALQELLTRTQQPVVFLERGFFVRLDFLAMSNTGLRYLFLNAGGGYTDVFATDSLLTKDFRTGEGMVQKFGNLDPRSVLGRMARAVEPSLIEKLQARRK